MTARELNDIAEAFMAGEWAGLLATAHADMANCHDVSDITVAAWRKNETLWPVFLDGFNSLKGTTP